MTKQEFANWAAEGLILMDGATGSLLMEKGMPQNESTEIWMLEHPDLVKEVQRSYVEAGSQIVYAPTFSANRIALKRHGLAERTEELNTRLVELSRDAVSGKALVAGDLTMTGELMEPLGDMTEEELLDIYRQQIRAQKEAGVDLFGIETMLTLEETAVALKAVQQICDLPVMCTLTVNGDGMTLYGTDIIEAARALEKQGALAVGINCSLGPDQAEKVIRNLKNTVDIPVIAKPNAGLPKAGADGKVIYSMDAESFAVHMEKLVEAGANLIGGCCGTTPEYIRRLGALEK